MKRLLYTLLLTLLCCMLFLSLCCKDEPTRPPDNKNNDPRKYTWTIDTISYPGSNQTLMRDITCLDSSNDAYIVGFNDQMIGNVYHFSGTTWEPIRLVTYVGGSIDGGVNFSSIFCFSKNNIWIVGKRLYQNSSQSSIFSDSSLILQYDGIKWKEYKVHGGSELRSIWGASPFSIWTVGLDGSVYYYDGLTWIKKTIRNDISFKCVRGTSTSDIYALGYRLDIMPYDSISEYIFHFDGSRWNLQDSMIETSQNRYNFGISMINVFSGTDIYSVGYGIFRKEGGSWSKVYDDGTIISGIGGSNSKNIFAVGEGIRHFNGSDWYRYPQFMDRNITIYRIWANENTVFAVGNDGHVTYVFHGK